MSDRPRPPARGLDALIGEAKQDLTPRVTDEAWSALEERIVARMAEEPAGRAPAAAAPHPTTPAAATSSASCASERSLSPPPQRSW